MQPAGDAINSALLEAIVIRGSGFAAQVAWIKRNWDGSTGCDKAGSIRIPVAGSTAISCSAELNFDATQL